jgi:hypothetical protein
MNQSAASKPPKTNVENLFQISNTNKLSGVGIRNEWKSMTEETEYDQETVFIRRRAVSWTIDRRVSTSFKKKKKKNTISVEKRNKRARYIDILVYRERKSCGSECCCWFDSLKAIHTRLSNSKFYIVSSSSSSSLKLDVRNTTSRSELVPF